jgi:hypothetical protein
VAPLLNKKNSNINRLYTKMAQTDFVYSQEQEPHRTRTKVILKEHPEVRNLIGKNPYTFLVILGVVALQLTLPTC